ADAGEKRCSPAATENVLLHEFVALPTRQGAPVSALIGANSASAPRIPGQGVSAGLRAANAILASYREPGHPVAEKSQAKPVALSLPQRTIKGKRAPDPRAPANRAAPSVYV